MDLWQDLRFAARRLLTERSFTAIAVGTLALGIGATTAIFSVVDAILVQPLPYKDADRLVQIINHRTEGSTPRRARMLSLPYFLGVREHARTFSAIGGYDSFSNLTRQRLAMLIEGGQGAAELLGTRVSPVLLSELGTQPALGRVFENVEEQAGRNGVIILSHRAWRTYFGGEADILRRSLTLDRRSYSVVGVMPPEFQFPDRQTDFWIPLTPALLPPPSAPRSDSPETYYADAVFGRLEDGMSPDAATAEIESILRQIDLELAAEYKWPLDRLGTPASLPRRAEIVPMKAELVAPVRPALRVLPFAAALVLLIACGNVANLLLARAASRQRELAIRAALGAARGRLVRETMTESLVLALAGGSLGLLLALWAMQVIVTLAPFDIPRIDEVGFDSRTVLYALAISSLTCIAVGLVPALRVAAADHSGALTRSHDRAPSSSVTGRFGTRNPAVVAEIAMATVLLIGAGLLIRSFVALITVNPGYDARQVLTFQVVLPPARASEPGDFYEQLMTRLESIPAVRAAGATDVLPIAGTGGFHFVLEGLPSPPRTGDTMTMRIVSRNYFGAMGIDILEGRTFSEIDGSGGPGTILVNREFVRRYFGGQSPLGRIVGRAPTTYEIVGVVEDVRHAGLHAEAQPEYYVDFRQFPFFGSVRPYFVVRTDGSPIGLAPTIRSLVRQIDPQAGVDLNVATMADIVSRSVTRPRFHAALLSVFAAAALVLAAIGIYGVMAYSIARRTREIGIRVALGARRSNVIGLVLRQSAGMIAIGILLGLAGAAMVTRYLQGMLFGLTPLDPATFAAVAVTWASVATLAAYVPARRATKVDPLIALRCE